jgi:hypothetical protein
MDKAFFDKFFSAYFYKLAQSDNMPTFTRTASLPVYKDENTKWLNDNAEKVNMLNEWVKNTERGF